MKKTIVVLCTAIAAGCQHSPEVELTDFPIYDPCFVYPVETEFRVSCNWNSGESDFDMKGCIESAGMPVTKTVLPGETRITYHLADGTPDKGEAIRRANAMRLCISKDM